jgi:hypothetical protein
VCLGGGGGDVSVEKTPSTMCILSTDLTRSAVVNSDKGYLMCMFETCKQLQSMEGFNKQVQSDC